MLLVVTVGAIACESSGKSQLVLVAPDGTRWTGRQDIVIKGIQNKGFQLKDCVAEESDGKNKFVMLLGDSNRKKESLQLMNLHQHQQ